MESLLSSRILQCKRCFQIAVGHRSKRVAHGTLYQSRKVLSSCTTPIRVCWRANASSSPLMLSCCSLLGLGCSDVGSVFTDEVKLDWHDRVSSVSAAFRAASCFMPGFSVLVSDNDLGYLPLMLSRSFLFSSASTPFSAVTGCTASDELWSSITTR